MKRYRFRLSSVLRVRRIQEEMARKELIEAARDEVRAEEKLTARAEHYVHLPAQSLDVPTDDFLAHRSRSLAAAAAVAAARSNWQMSMAVTTARRAAWSAAERRVQSLERLDDRDREEHLREVLRQEQLELDDLAARPQEGDDR